MRNQLVANNGRELRAVRCAESQSSGFPFSDGFALTASIRATRPGKKAASRFPGSCLICLFGRLASASAPSCYGCGEGEEVKLIVIDEVKFVIEERHCCISIL